MQLLLQNPESIYVIIFENREVTSYLSILRDGFQNDDLILQDAVNQFS
jgi:hypothetical protein